MIRVALVENEALVREGLRRVLMLDPELAVAGEARDGIEALELIERLHPQVVLLDMRMPRLDGVGVLEALQKLVGAPPRCRWPSTTDRVSLPVSPCSASHTWAPMPPSRSAARPCAASRSDSVPPFGNAPSATTTMLNFAPH